MDRFTEAEIFTATVEAGSVSGAARVLGVNKSVVSRRLSALEARLGVGLLNRSSRKLSLTEAGETYHARATELLRDWRDMEDGLRGEGEALTGRIRIAAPLSFGLSQLSPLLLEFARKHPGVRLDTDFSDRRTDLVGEGFDLAVRIGALPDSELRARKLGTAAMIAVSAPDWEGSGANGAEALQGAGELRYALRSPGDTALGTVELMRSSSGDFLRDGAIAGLGMTVLPEFIICDAVRDGRLVQLLPDDHFAPLDIHAVYPATRFQPRQVRALIEFLAERFASAPWSLSRDRP